jgi:hypothetical protein
LFCTCTHLADDYGRRSPTHTCHTPTPPMPPIHQPIIAHQSACPYRHPGFFFFSFFFFFTLWTFCFCLSVTTAESNGLVGPASVRQLLPIPLLPWHSWLRSVFGTAQASGGRQGNAYEPQGREWRGSRFIWIHGGEVRQVLSGRLDSGTNHWITGSLDHLHASLCLNNARRRLSPTTRSRS